MRWLVRRVRTHRTHARDDGLLPPPTEGVKTQRNTSIVYAQPARAAAKLPYEQALVGVAKLGKRRLARPVDHRRRAANHHLCGPSQMPRACKRHGRGPGASTHQGVLPRRGQVGLDLHGCGAVSAASWLSRHGAYHFSRDKAGAEGPLGGRAVKRVVQLWLASVATLCAHHKHPHAP